MARIAAAAADGCDVLSKLLRARLYAALGLSEDQRDVYTHARNVGEGIRGVVVAGVHVNQTLSPTLILRQCNQSKPIASEYTLRSWSGLSARAKRR